MDAPASVFCLYGVSVSHHVIFVLVVSPCAFQEFSYSTIGLF